MPCPPRMQGCRRDCLHRAMVEDYRAKREREEERLEERTGGYPADRALELAREPIVTFKSWLTRLAGSQAYARFPGEPAA